MKSRILRHLTSFFVMLHDLLRRRKMVTKTKLLMIGVLCSLFITGCYPTGEIVGNSNISYGSELNESPYEGLNYKLILPDDYPETYSITKAKLRNFDTSLAESLFPDCTKDTVDIQIDEENKYALYRKKESDVCFMPGTVIYNKKNENKTELLVNALTMPKTDEQIRDEFPRTELPGFSSDGSLAEINRVIDLLDIETTGPQIYAITDEEAEYVNSTYCEGAFDGIICNDSYIIKYTPTLDGLPVANHSFLSTMSDWVATSSRIYGLFDENGMIELTVRDIPEVYKREKNEKICSPEFAVSQMKEYFEGMHKNGTVFGCELRALVYIYSGEVTDEYEVRPVWVFGWQDDDMDRPNPCYIDAVSGNIL